MSDKRAGPIETLVAELAATLAPGRRVGLEEGITLTVDGAGRVRFQVRLRLAGRDSKRKTATVDTLEQARELRTAFRQAKRGGSSLAQGGSTRKQTKPESERPEHAVVRDIVHARANRQAPQGPETAVRRGS